MPDDKDTKQPQPTDKSKLIGEETLGTRVSARSGVSPSFTIPTQTSPPPEQPTSKRRRLDYTLGFLGAGMTVLTILLPPGTPRAAVFYLTVLFALFVYPCLHFAEWVLRSTALWARSCGVIALAVAVVAVGFRVWPKPEHPLSAAEIAEEVANRIRGESGNKKQETQQTQPQQATQTATAAGAGNGTTENTIGSEPKADITHKPPKHTEKSVLPPTPSEIADEVAKRLSQAQTANTEIEKIRAEAVSVIRGLQSLSNGWNDNDHTLQGRLMDPAIKPENLEGHRMLVQQSRQYNNDEFTARYRKNYLRRVLSVRDDLLGHIQHMPYRDSSVDSYYDDDIQPGWSPMMKIVSQIRDLTILLNQFEQENGFPISRFPNR